MKKSISINLYICFSVLVVTVGIIFCIYYLTLFQTKKFSIDSNTILELNENVVINQVQTGKLFSKIQVTVEKNEENVKDYINFVSGPGTGYYINYNIIIEKANEQYKIKTMLKENTDTKIVLEGYVYNNFLNEEYEIGVLQKDYNNETKEDIFRYSIIK